MQDPNLCQQIRQTRRINHRLNHHIQNRRANRQRRKPSLGHALRSRNSRRQRPRSPGKNHDNFVRTIKYVKEKSNRG